MYNQETMEWTDGNLPHDNQLVDGYGKREPETEWEQDLITIISNSLEHEPDLEE